MALLLLLPALLSLEVVSFAIYSCDVFSRRVICSGVPHPSKPLVAAIAALIIPAPPRIVAALDTQSYIHMYIYICIYIYI